MKALVSIAGLLLLIAAAADIGEARRRDSWEAFGDVAAVLKSPRCQNCHIQGDAPLQGDDGHRHNMNVRRAEDGRGTPAARCTNCHQQANSLALHSPPGAPGWRLPSRAAPMAWLGLSTEQMCRNLKNAAFNGGRTLAQLVEHVTSDQLVNWGWNPGPGRAPPPISHEQFVQRFVQWVEGGAPCSAVETPSRSTDDQ